MLEFVVSDVYEPTEKPGVLKDLSVDSSVETPFVPTSTGLVLPLRSRTNEWTKGRFHRRVTPVNRLPRRLDHTLGTPVQGVRGPDTHRQGLGRQGRSTHFVSTVDVRGESSDPPTTTGTLTAKHVGTTTQSRPLFLQWVAWGVFLGGRSRP